MDGFQDLQIAQRDGVEDEVVGHFVEAEPGQVRHVAAQVSAEVMENGSGGPGGCGAVAQAEPIERGHLEVFAQGKEGRLGHENPVVMRRELCAVLAQ